MKPRTFHEILERAPVIRQDETRLRMTHVDSGARPKLQSLLELMFGALFDTWRERFAMRDLLAQGIWPFAQALEIDATHEALAVGQLAQLRTAVAAARVESARGSDIVLGTRIELDAARGDGQLDRAASLRLAWRLLRPFANPNARRVAELPDALRELRAQPCEPLASIGLCDAADCDTTLEPSTSEQRITFGLQDTDTNQVVYTGAYLALAESCATAHAKAAELPVETLRHTRARLEFKRPFGAGTQCAIRTQLQARASARRVQTLVSFHAVDAQSVDARAGARVRFESFY